MKKLTVLFVFMFLGNVILAQVSGNVNYDNQGKRYLSNSIDINFPSDADLFVSVKGLANVEADTYVAIFNLTQIGKTIEEVNKLMDERITQALKNIKGKAGVETYVDMISFVPMYEYDVEKKIFSKKTYNEVPVGFEVKKNIHIKYTDPNLLNEIIAILSKAEVYDLVRVDYFSNQLEAIKSELMTKSKTILQDKIKNYEDILSIHLDSIEKKIVDGYKVVLPVERYQSYQAYSSSSLNFKKRSTVNQANKSTTLYYQPVIDKDFDFVINPTILEPVIQVLYEIKLKINKIKRVNRVQRQVLSPNTEYIFVTPNGDLKKLDIK